MKVHNKKLLTEFSSAHVDAKSQIEALVSELEIATWSTPHELKQRYPKASIIGNNNVMFVTVQTNQQKMNTRKVVLIMASSKIFDVSGYLLSLHV